MDPAITETLRQLKERLPIELHEILDLLAAGFVAQAGRLLGVTGYSRTIQALLTMAGNRGAGQLMQRFYYSSCAPVSSAGPLP